MCIRDRQENPRSRDIASMPIADAVALINDEDARVAEAVRLMFVRNGLLWGGIGAAVGLVAAVPMSQAMTSLLFEVKPIDPMTYGAVAAGLLGAAALASYLPTRRVTRIEPVEALRAE